MIAARRGNHLARERSLHRKKAMIAAKSRRSLLAKGRYLLKRNQVMIAARRRSL